MSAKIKSHNTSISHHKHKPKKVSSRAFEKVYWPYLPVILAVCGLLTLGVRSGALSHPLGKVMSYASSMQTTALLSDTNTVRIDNQDGPLKLNDKLMAAAQAKANDMAARDYWSHKTPDGQEPWVFVAENSYNYQKLGENLATGFSDEQSAINGWMASPPHRENLLDPAYSEVGFGVASIPNYIAAGGGPMTLVVAFYGEPAGSTIVDASNASNLTPVAANTNQLSNDKVLASHTSRAQLALATTGLTAEATKLAIIGLIVVIGLWSYRHIRILHRTIVHGEAFAVHHPLVDVGVVVIVSLLFILSRTAGLTQ